MPDGRRNLGALPLAAAGIISAGARGARTGRRVGRKALAVTGVLLFARRRGLKVALVLNANLGALESQYRMLLRAAAPIGTGALRSSIDVRAKVSGLRITMIVKQETHGFIQHYGSDQVHQGWMNRPTQIFLANVPKRLDIGVALAGFN